MRKNYFNNFRESLISRRHSDTLKVKTIIFSVVVCTLIYISFAILMHPENETLDYHFYSERGLITALSAILLAMAGAFALATLVVHVRMKVADIWPWALMTLGYTFLALDETGQFHERLGDLVDEQSNSGIFRNWNDVIVILYGVVALPVVAALLPSIVKYRMTFELFLLAFIFYVVHTLIDSTQEPSTTSSIIMEESAKLYCGAFLVLSMFFSFLGALWATEPPDG